MKRISTVSERECIAILHINRLSTLIFHSNTLGLTVYRPTEEVLILFQRGYFWVDSIGFHCARCNGHTWCSILSVGWALEEDSQVCFSLRCWCNISTRHWMANVELAIIPFNTKYPPKGAICTPHGNTFCFCRDESAPNGSCSTRIGSEWKAHRAYKWILISIYEINDVRVHVRHKGTNSNAFFRFHSRRHFRAFFNGFHVLRRPISLTPIMYVLYLYGIRISLFYRIVQFLVRPTTEGGNSAVSCKPSTNFLCSWNPTKQRKV